ncbi:MAG: OmpA family protein [Pseudomonadota bacterium]
MRSIFATSILALAITFPAKAQELRFPAEAEQNASRTSNDSLFMPLGPFENDALAGITVEGEVQQSAWSVGDGALTTMELLKPLRDEFLASGFEPIFECVASVCGGFDFRYSVDVLPEPDMHVNLGDYRYFSAKRSDAGGTPEYITILVSRSANAGFVQLTRVGDPNSAAVLTTSTKAPAPPTTVLPALTGTLTEQLESAGHATLADLAFQVGSSQLTSDSFASLESLAAFLNANSDRTVTLVGHTDAEGPLASNVTLSRRRATEVMLRLIDAYDVSPAQVSADGVGFLAPRASNLTEEGRTKNRRVEVILTSTR